MNAHATPDRCQIGFSGIFDYQLHKTATLPSPDIDIIRDKWSKEKKGRCSIPNDRTTNIPNKSKQRLKVSRQKKLNAPSIMKCIQLSPSGNVHLNLFLIRTPFQLVFKHPVPIPPCNSFMIRNNINPIIPQPLTRGKLTRRL